MGDSIRPPLEVSSALEVKKSGERPATWYALPRGLFSERPHLLLQEHFWDSAPRVAMDRFYVIESGSGAVTRYAAGTQAYEQDEYRSMLTDAGFHNIQFPALGPEGAWPGDFLVIVAEK